MRQSVRAEEGFLRTNEMYYCTLALSLTSTITNGATSAINDGATNAFTDSTSAYCDTSKFRRPVLGLSDAFH